MCVRERVSHEGKLCADHDHDYEYEHEHVVNWASTSESKLVSKLVSVRGTAESVLRV